MVFKMTDEPENLVLLMLREIRSKQDEHSSRLDHIDTRLASIDRQLDDYKKIVRTRYVVRNRIEASSAGISNRCGIQEAGEASV
jgi:hypothetical protein